MTKAAAETNGAVEVVQVIADIDAPEPAEEKINAYLAAHAAEVDGIVTTAWVPAVVSANALRKIGDKRIQMVGIDHDEVVLKAIKDGFVDGTMLQNPYGQGYVGTFAIDKLRSGCKVKADAPFGSTAQTNRFIDSGTAFVDASGVDNYIGAMQAVTADADEDLRGDLSDLRLNASLPTARDGGLERSPGGAARQDIDAAGKHASRGSGQTGPNLLVCPGGLPMAATSSA